MIRDDNIDDAIDVDRREVDNGDELEKHMTNKPPLLDDCRPSSSLPTSLLLSPLKIVTANNTRHSSTIK